LTTKQRRGTNNSMTKTPSVGRTIKDARTRAGKTLEQLGYEADLTAATVSRIESGKHSPTLRTLEQIAKALGFVVIIRIVRKKNGKRKKA